MIFSLLTFLTALALAAVAGWFSIAGIMTIYAGAPIFAAVLGIVTECGKLITISWLYRNWNDCTWKLKAPLIYFTIALMVITSIGVFGFLSKAHLEQNASTIDNSARVEQLNRQIERERSIITDSEKLVAQLDSTVNSFLGKDRADRSLAVRRTQAPQRAQLRKEISEAQARIDQLSEEKFKYESEIRKLELEVGPIRYIAEIIYGKDGDRQSNLESAVKMFTLLVVSTLDPLASVLLIAANSSWQRRRRNEKNQATTQVQETVLISESERRSQSNESSKTGESYRELEFPEEQEAPIPEIKINEKNSKDSNSQEGLPVYIEYPEITDANFEPEGTSPDNQETKLPIQEKFVAQSSESVLQIKKSVEPTAKDSSQSIRAEVSLTSPWAQQQDALSGILGSHAHFIPEKVIPPSAEIKKIEAKPLKKNKYHISSWIDKFGEQDGKRTRKDN